MVVLLLQAPVLRHQLVLVENDFVAILYQIWA